MLHVPLYRTDIVPVILCGCEIWFLRLGKNTDSGFCDSRVVRRIFDESEVRMEGCRRFCSELHFCYCSPDIINIIVARKYRTCHVACI